MLKDSQDNTTLVFYNNMLAQLNSKSGFSQEQISNYMDAIGNFYEGIQNNRPLTDTENNQQAQLISILQNEITTDNPDLYNQTPVKPIEGDNGGFLNNLLSNIPVPTLPTWFTAPNFTVIIAVTGGILGLILWKVYSGSKNENKQL
jgi:hypothetical protein